MEGERKRQAGRRALSREEKEKGVGKPSQYFFFGFKKKVGAGWQTAMYFSPIDLFLRLAFYLGNIPCVGCLMGKGKKSN